ncbi:uncharacterized protein LOC121891966 [Thunnus maccoyii]|uniref:uncharacterized protein LOC121891966 n=1 Tax=Thunnus maccoyii TaxID=8240 RepID=UPI001C4AE6FB|nr:uncharacterized protein LOC121891966 [Thunnus maccoyii]
MAVWKLWFVLLLLLPAYNNSQVTFVKTTGREPYITPICTNETLNMLTLIICKIRTERSRGEECRLMYKYGQDFENECDSRFTLMKKNQTIFLHLTSLTPVDSGNYSCECIYPGRTDTLHLHITVEVNSSATVEDEEATSSTKISIASAAVGVTVFIIITGVIHRRKHHRNCSRTDTSGSSVCKSPGSLDPDDPDDPYTSLQQPANDLYQTISSIHHQHDAKTTSASNIMELDDQEMDGRETDPSWEIYENT